MRVNKEYAAGEDMKKAYSSAKKNKQKGWCYIKVEGDAATRGRGYGYYMAEEIIEAIKEARELVYVQNGVEWDFFRQSGVVENWMNKIQEEPYKEFYDEIKGMIEGICCSDIAEKYADFPLDEKIC